MEGGTMTDKEKIRMLLKWNDQLQHSIKISESIKGHGYTKIAVCGYREYGRLLVSQLLAEGMEPVCIIEKNYQSLSQIEENLPIPIVGFLDTELIAKADCILVTPDINMPEVREDVEMAQIKIPLRSLEYFIL